ncbi:MAG: right-handed parallel beta-helix repeat-containing protein [Bacteroidales bacterium]|nr:right-handed parallel beta-helix repeat-containing protein [Bacteroidales bacterium]
MRFLRILSLFILFLAPAITATSVETERYVSPQGNNSWPGTKAKPWKSLEYAFSQIMAGEGDVRLVLLDGNYYPENALSLQGIRGRSISIEAAPGASPVIRGDRKITGFRKNGQLLEADLTRSGVQDLGGACQKGNLVDLYWKGIRQSIASYPDSGFLIASDALGETRLDDVGHKEGVFKYDDDLISSWADEKDAWIYGYFRWDWRDDYGKIVSIDTSEKTITLSEPWHNYGYRSGFKFRGVNLLCALDSPGEYYIDREKGKLYWFPPEGYVKGDEVSLSVFNSDAMMEVSDCEGVTIKGLTFAGGRANAVSVIASRDVLLDRIKVSRFGGDALHVSSSENVTIESCRFETLGHTGMNLSGGDRRTLRHSGYLVNNTIVKDISLFRHTYEPALIFQGCGLTVSHCEFSGSSSSAMRIEGNDTVIEYCHFHDLVKESDDQGALDMFYNYGYRGNVIRFNLWENIRGGSIHGSAGVRLDDMISGQYIYGNIFRNVGGVHFGAVQIHGGKDNLVENNLIYDCNFGVSFSPWGQSRWDEALEREEVQKKIHGEVDIESSLYKERYPELNGDIHANVDRNIVRNNLIVGCRRMFYDDKGQNYLQNNHGISIGEDPVTESLEYYLLPEVLAKYGLKPIPFKEIGPKSE